MTDSKAEVIVLVILGVYSIVGVAIIWEKFKYLAEAGAALKARMSAGLQSAISHAVLAKAFTETHSAKGDKSAALDRELALVRDRATAGMVYLATIGNTAPFVGLFGTVLGIMEAFKSIAAKGSPGFAEVSGPLSSALIATAAGLGVAIPAVAFYNYFGRRIQSHLTEVRYVLEREVTGEGV
ncbi:MAG: MotA/TolQ/ExbB proton channel family protein [bacterium]